MRPQPGNRFVSFVRASERARDQRFDCAARAVVRPFYFLLLLRKNHAGWVVREKPYKTLLKSTFFVDNPPGMVLPPQQEQVNCPHNSPSYTIESPLARPHSFASPRPLARTTRTETEIRFPGWTQAPQPPIHIYVYVDLYGACS